MTALKMEFSWKTEGVRFTIKNVPHEVHEEFDEPLIDMSVAITITALRDLMVSGEIDTTDLDYDDFKSVIY